MTAESTENWQFMGVTTYRSRFELRAKILKTIEVTNLCIGEVARVCDCEPQYVRRMVVRVGFARTSRRPTGRRKNVTLTQKGTAWLDQYGRRR